MAVNELSDNIYCNTITVTTFDDDTNTTSSTSMWYVFSMRACRNCVCVCMCVCVYCKYGNYHGI